jgi:hypothetical protein
VCPFALTVLFGLFDYSPYHTSSGFDCGVITLLTVSRLSVVACGENLC